jgi:hypothetical protein
VRAVVCALCHARGRTRAQWRDLAFCLAQLPLNERGVKRLLDPAVWRLVQVSVVCTRACVAVCHCVRCVITALHSLRWATMTCTATLRAWSPRRANSRPRCV